MIQFLLRLYKYAKPYRFRLFLGFFCGIISGATAGGLMLVMRVVVNLAFGDGTVTFVKEAEQLPSILRGMAVKLADWIPELNKPSSKTALVVAVLGIPVVMFLRSFFGQLNIYLTNWAAVRAVGDIRTELFNHLQSLSLSFFNKAKTGELISRITNDTQILHSLIGSSCNSMLKDPITVLILMVLAISQQPKLTLVSMLVMPLCLVPIIVYGKKVRRSVKAMQTHFGDLSNLMHESFTANRIIKAYNLESTVLGQFRQTTRDYIRQIMKTIWSGELPSQIMEFFGAIGVSLVLLYVAVSDMTIKPGDMLAFIGSIFFMYQPIKTISRLHNQLEQARAASSRVFELLDTKSDIVDPENPVPLQAKGAEIVFESVDFSYGEKKVLSGINLTVKPGQLVALVGASGSGKTTITNLLLRFYDPQGGSVRIGGVDIRQTAIKDLRRQIALVAQETILFNDTIKQNIAYGRAEASDVEIEAAARHAHAHEFIVEKPEGYNTVIGEKGISLSGGQRQRLAIARAIIKQAPILVLDEATSALDTESERLVQAALEELMVGHTTICIAHRLSTIQKADKIVVLDQGCIVETGTHAELIQRGGVYRKLYDLQFNG